MGSCRAQGVYAGSYRRHRGRVAVSLVAVRACFRQVKVLGITHTSASVCRSLTSLLACSTVSKKAGLGWGTA